MNLEFNDLKNPELFFNSLDSLSEMELCNFLFEWHREGEKADELIPFIEFFRAKSPPQQLNREAFDCAGTGGDKSDTFNFSTSAAFIAAAMGLSLVKNGGRAGSSKTGSVDFLECLGLDMSLDIENNIRNFYDYGLAFLSSPITANYLKQVKAIARNHKRSTFANLIAPFLSPVEVHGQLIGVAKRSWINTCIELAKYFIEKGYRQKFILVHSENPADPSKVLDEASSIWPFKIIFIDANGVFDHQFLPTGLGLRSGEIADLRGANAEENAKLFWDLIEAKIPQGDYTEWSGMQSKFDTLLLNSALLMALREDFSGFKRFPNFLTFYELEIAKIKEKILDKTVLSFVKEYCN